MRRSLFVFPVALLVACGGGAGSDADPAETPLAAVPATAPEEPPAETPSVAPTTAPEGPFDPDRANLTRLIFWEDMIQAFFVDEQPSTFELALLQELLDAPPPAADPYLTDLAGLPSPYVSLLLDHLRARFQRPEARSLHTFPELLQAGTPDEDSANYLRFKQAMFASLTEEYRTLLDPARPRTVSAREVVWGGVGVDGIPPLELPRFLTPADAAAWILPDDDVIGVEINGDARAYPIRIIGWHEMVNDTVGGVPVSLTYCTLCGSAILYEGRVGSEIYRFGTSGLLYRSNKLMYDRTTNSLWEQFAGEPVWGPLVDAGVSLTVRPTVVTTWRAWLEAHPDTTVLDIDTGFRRDYAPGAAYREYNASPDLIFAVPTTDDRLGDKDDVYVVRVGDDLTAYPVALLAERGLINDAVGDLAVVVVATPDGKGGRAYASGGRSFALVDRERTVLAGSDGRRWTVTEPALVADDGEPLERLNGHNSFWFAVVNHSPEGRLYDPAERDAS